MPNKFSNEATSNAFAWINSDCCLNFRVKDIKKASIDKADLAEHLRLVLHTSKRLDNKLSNISFDDLSIVDWEELARRV